jgi:hypothetical protein
VVNQDLIEGRSVVSLIFSSLYGILNKENNDQDDEKEDAHEPEDVPGSVRALPALEFGGTLISNIAICAEDSLVPHIAFPFRVIQGLLKSLATDYAAPKSILTTENLHASWEVPALDEV